MRALALLLLLTGCARDYDHFLHSPPDLSPSDSGVARCPATGFQTALALPYALKYATAVFFQGKIYVIGGAQLMGTAVSATGAVWSLDLSDAKATWNPEASLSTPRYKHAAVVLGNQIVVIGGFTAPMDEMATNSVEVFDGGTSWQSPSSSVPDTINAHASFTAAVSGDKIYVFDLSGSEYFTDSWTPFDFSPTPRTRASAVTVAGGKIEVIGGATISLSTCTGSSSMVGCALSTVAELDPMTNTLTTLPSLTNARAYSVAALDAKQRVLAIGGVDPMENLVPSVELETPPGGWSTITPTPTAPRAGAVAVTSDDGTVYLIGGYTDNSSKQPMPDVLYYCPAS